MNIQSAPSAASRPENENPALAAFVAEPWTEIAFAQALIRRAKGGFELRHAEDAAAATLKPVSLNEVRALANFTEANEYRPLKTMPNLRRGWLLQVANAAELEFALAQLYPGAVPDWFAARASPPPITDYKPFTTRQSGMYRVTTILTDAEVSEVIDKTCATVCLKQRLWTNADKPADARGAKSIIPCLEPCAILLENARKAARLRQSNELGLQPPANI